MKIYYEYEGLIGKLKRKTAITYFNLHHYSLLLAEENHVESQSKISLTYKCSMHCF